MSYLTPRERTWDAAQKDLAAALLDAIDGLDARDHVVEIRRDAEGKLVVKAPFGRALRQRIEDAYAAEAREREARAAETVG